MSGSYEQLHEEIVRQIIATKHKLLDDFFKAYAAQLAHLGDDLDLSDICLCEQEPHFRDGKITRRYWFEHKPKFDND